MTHYPAHLYYRYLWEYLPPELRTPAVYRQIMALWQRENEENPRWAGEIDSPHPSAKMTTNLLTL